MFYKSVNKNSVKDMFEFLNNHFTYWTMNSWNRLESIANNVKVYNLKLDYEILDILQADDYFTINMMIEDWEAEHKGYKVGFNGRSGGYLVLYNDDSNGNILPSWLDYDNYDDFKNDYIKVYYNKVADIKDDIKYYVELVQDFDKLCDDLLEQCKYMLENCKVVEKEIQVPKTIKVLEWSED